MDADEDGDTILGHLDSGLGGDLLRSPYQKESLNLLPMCFGHLERTMGIGTGARFSPL